jgi:RNA recognition motif-containing protein
LNIFAGNLSVNVTEEDLRTEFRAYGKVAFVNIVKDRSKRVSAGFGFIEMPEQAEAEAAIAALSGKELKGQAITVNDARPRSLKVPEKAAETVVEKVAE